MPKYIPRLPSKKAPRKRKFSDILLFRFTAKVLSINIIIKLKIFINNK